MHDQLARDRALHALDNIEHYYQHVTNQEARLAYISYIKATPAIIRRNGLGTALAVLLSRAGQDNGLGQGGRAPGAYRAIYNHLQDWLCSASEAAPFNPKDNLLRKVTESDQRTYITAQNEAGLYIDLLKKFANAILTEDGNGGGSQ